MEHVHIDIENGDEVTGIELMNQIVEPFIVRELDLHACVEYNGEII